MALRFFRVKTLAFPSSPPHFKAVLKAEMRTSPLIKTLPALYVLTTTLSCLAQTPAPPAEVTAPTGAAWVRPEPPMSWTISFRYAAAPKSPAEDTRPVKVSVSTVGTTTLKSVATANRAVDVWTAAGITFLVDPSSGEYHIPAALSEEDAALAQANGPAPEEQDWLSLQEFDWVRSDLFQGTIKIGNDLVHVYAQLPQDMLAAQNAAANAPRAVAGRPATQAAPKATVQKWPAGPIGGLPLRPDIKVVAVDTQTRRPKYLQLGQDMREYTFSKPAALDIPKPIVARLRVMGIQLAP